MPSPRVLALLFLVAFSCRVLAEDPPELILLDGVVVTMNESKPEAQAIAVRDGKIVSIGATDAVRRLKGDRTRIVDLAGRLTIPGFIETHGHFSSMGYAKMNLELQAAKSWNEIVAQVAEAAEQRPKGEWIVGRGWHQEKWQEPLEKNVEGYPLHDKLSQVAPDHPVLLTHASGHMSIANALALSLARIGDQTADPDGGEILRDEKGRATGVLREAADGLVSRVRDRDSQGAEMWQQAVLQAGHECLENGVTSFHDAGTRFVEIDQYRELADKGELPLRLYIMARDSVDAMAKRLPEYRMIDRGNGFLTVRSIKQSLDGALGSHGAWLSEPYEDLVTSTGLNTLPLKTLERVAKLAAEYDYQLCVHAIGDRANHEVLNLYERSFRDKPSADHRWRIEHAQHLLTEDIPRFASWALSQPCKVCIARPTQFSLASGWGNAAQRTGPICGDLF